MKVYGVFVIWDDGVEAQVATYTTMEEAEKHRAYNESLPWSMKPCQEYVVVEMEVLEKFKPYFTDEEIAQGRKWDEEHKEEIINR